MRETILSIMHQNFESERLLCALEEIITDTMEEAYHELAHEILSEYDPLELLKEVAEEEFETPF